MSTPTIISQNSKAQDSRVFMASHGGIFAEVSAVTATTVTLDSVEGLTGTGLYAVASPGMLEIIESADSSANHGDVANITGVAGSVLTVDQDYATGGELAAGDIVMVLPPLAVELFQPSNSPHTMNVTMEDDDTMGLTKTFPTHNTRLGTRVGGNVSFFQTATSEGLVRLLMAGVGGYRLNGGVHELQPKKSDDPDTPIFTDTSDFTIYTEDGNDVLAQAWFALFGTTLTLDYPNKGVAMGSLGTLGAGTAREIGGTGKDYPDGANSWISDSLECDTGPRHTYQGAFVEFDTGSFGDDLTSADRYIQNVSFTINRGAVEDDVLGAQYIVKPIEESHGIVATGTRILEDDTIFEKGYGGATAAEPGVSQEGRFLLKSVLPGDATKTLRLDIPNARYKFGEVGRKRGRFTQDFTVQGIHTLDGDGCIDYANPLYRIYVDNGDATDYSTSL